MARRRHGILEGRQAGAGLGKLTLQGMAPTTRLIRLRHLLARPAQTFGKPGSRFAVGVRLELRPQALANGLRSIRFRFFLAFDVFLFSPAFQHLAALKQALACHFRRHWRPSARFSQCHPAGMPFAGALDQQLQRGRHGLKLLRQQGQSPGLGLPINLVLQFVQTGIGEIIGLTDALLIIGGQVRQFMRGCLDRTPA